jgi:hypothetical protein
MKRSKELLNKRKDYVIAYINENQNKQMKVVVAELSNNLFLTERTIYSIIKEASICLKFDSQSEKHKDILSS